MRTSHGFVAVMSLALGLASGCATKQTVSLACVPEEYTVYVDGEILKGGYESIELRAGEPHKIYVKGPGHEPVSSSSSRGPTARAGCASSPRTPAGSSSRCRSNATS